MSLRLRPTMLSEEGDQLTRIGFVILQGCRNPNGSVELKRLVLQAKGRGLGRAAVRQLKAMGFVQIKAHRFWLDVKLLNIRALKLYQSEGFLEEGRLRESVRIGRPLGRSRPSSWSSRTTSAMRCHRVVPSA